MTADVRIRADPDWPTAELVGEIDLSIVDHLITVLEDSIANTVTGLILDLSGVTFLDSTGLRLIFRLARQLRDRQQQLLLVLPSTSPIRRVLIVAGVESVAQIVAEVPGPIELAASGLLVDD